MFKIAVGATALTFLTLSAVAQTTSPGATDMPPQPSSPNSGAGIEGKPGHQSGPAVNPPETTGAATPDEANKMPQDTSKIPGLPGNKSGPAVRNPSPSDNK